MSKQKKKWIVDWEEKGPIGSSIHIEHIDDFDARGKHRVYGRGDQFGRRFTLNMDVWRSTSGRLLVRFWSRNYHVDWYSYEIFGITDEKKHGNGTTIEFGEHWVPESLREAYDSWVLSEL
jgi:hypothetical protein